MEFKKEKLVKSPLNYTGGKYKLLPQILPLFPDDIETFVDLFAGGCNVGLNSNSKNVIFNDIRKPIIDMYNELKNNVSKYGVDETIKLIEQTIYEHKLDNTNKEYFIKFKDNYNINKNPIDLFILSCFSFSNYINFNSNDEFNSSFGKRRFNKNTKERLYYFLLNINRFTFISKDFSDLKTEKLNNNDFVYLDPPYLITNSDYNSLWGETQELKLLQMLDILNENNIRFALSNVIHHKGKDNHLLKKWSEKYNTHFLDFNYDGCTYQDINKKTESVEVLITNY